MNRLFIVVCSLLGFTLFLAFANKRDDKLDQQQLVLQHLKAKNSILLNRYDSLTIAVTRASNTQEDLEKVKIYYLECRKAYKSVEWAVEYFAPGTATMLNAALIPKVNEDDPSLVTIEPEGFQYIEELIYADSVLLQREFLLAELKRSRGVVLRWKKIVEILEPLDFQVCEALRLELIRIWSLGLVGFDSPYSGNALIEAASALEGMQEVWQLFQGSIDGRKSRREFQDFLKEIRISIQVLKQGEAFEKFDRAEYIRQYANPLYSRMAGMQKLLNIPFPDFVTAVKYDANTIFDVDQWNLRYYSRFNNELDNHDKIALGKMLFYDPLLSGNNQRACASCHQPQFGFAEPIAKSKQFDDQKTVARNAPSLLNVAFQKGIFWDARLTYLEDQVVEVNQNNLEMHGNFQENVAKLNQSKEYQYLFKTAFKGTSDTLIAKQGIIKAIAAYERSLSSFNSRFDQYMRGNAQALNSSEINGFNIFMGKGLCGTCHFAPIFNGTVPPFFDKTEWEIIGTPATAENKRLDEDPGRFGAAGMELHRYAFKTPTIRNVEYTAPYMHNGVFKTLEEVVVFYQKGGGAGHGYEVPNQTLPFDQLELTDEEVKDIVAFMKSTSDTVGLTSKATRLPQFEGAAASWNSRPIGGSY